MSSHAQKRLARPLSDKTQPPMAQDIADDSSVFQQHLHPFVYVLLLQNWVRSYYAVLKIRNNAEIVCHEQTVVTRVAGDIQSSSQQNFGSHRLVLKPLHLCVESSSLSLSNPSMWNTEVSMQIIKYILSAMLHRPPARVYKWSSNHTWLAKVKSCKKTQWKQL